MPTKVFDDNNAGRAISIKCGIMTISYTNTQMLVGTKVNL